MYKLKLAYLHPTSTNQNWEIKVQMTSSQDIGGRGDPAWTSSAVAPMVVNSFSAKMSFRSFRKLGKID